MSARTSRRLAFLLPLVLAVGTLPVATIGPRPHVVFRKLSLRTPGALRAPAEFRMVGVSWPIGEQRPQQVRVRTSRDGKHWTKWNELDISTDEGPDRGSREGQISATAPLWVGRARFADVRWRGHLSSRAVLDVVDPGPDPVTPQASAEASPGQPAIITRSQWGADESIRKCCPEYAEPMQMAFIHHTASGNDYAASDSKAIVRSIYAYHVQTNGWNDIGYNFLVDRYGQIFEGRYGGMDRALVGAHSLGFNRHSTGISVIGTFGSVAPPAAAISAVKAITAWRLDRSYVDALGSTVMTSGGNPRYSAGTRVTLKTISGHRDVYDTDCPGSAFYSQLPSIRSGVAMLGDPKLMDPKLSAGVITPNGDGRADSVKITAHFSSTVSWTVDVLDPAGMKWFTQTGSGNSISSTWTGKNSSGTLAPHDRYRFVVNAHNAHGSVRALSMSFSSWRFPDGTLFRTPSGWSGILHGGHLSHVVALRPLQTRYHDGEAVAVPEVVRSVYNASSELGFRDGSVVRIGSSMWIISDSQRRPVSQATLTALGFPPGAIIDTTSSALGPTPPGSTVGTSSYPNGSALRSTDEHEAIILRGAGRPFLTTNVRTSWAIRNVDRAGPADMQVAAAQAGTQMGFRDGTLIRASGTTPVYVIANGKRRHVSSRHLFDAMGYKDANVRTVTAAELTLNPDGGPL